MMVVEGGGSDGGGGRWNTVTQDKDNFSRAEIGLFLPLWFTFYDTFPVVSFFLLNVVLIYPKLSL